MLLPGKAIEHPRHGLYQRLDIGAFRAQRKMTGLNARDIQNIANQFEQLAGRGRGHFNGETIHETLVGFFHGQLQHANNCIHGRADFMAHGRQEGGLGPVRFVRCLLGDIQLSHQLMTPGYDSLQVGNPGNCYQQQHRSDGKPLNNFGPIAQPVTLDRRRVYAPATGQFTHLSWGNTEQCFAQNRAQLRISASRGKADLLGLRTYCAGDLQLFVKASRDQIAGTDQRTDCAIRLALCHHAQGGRRVVSIHHLYIRVVLHNKGAQHIATHQGHTPAGHVIQGFGGIRPHTRGEHKGGGEIGPGKTQLIFPGGTARYSPQHISLARADQPDDPRHRAFAHSLELNAGACADVG